MNLLQSPATAIYTLASSCTNGLTFQCLEDPAMESWPGIGTWQPSVDDGQGEAHLLYV